jgi:N-acetylmuramoyl-L-alanine amidase
MKKRGTHNSLNMLLTVFFVHFFLHVSAHADSTLKPVIKTVVIDAGHGGKDPGCHGASAHEKSVCLSIALKLGALIKENYPQIKVIYTRDKDVFVELNERASIANRAKADLFICIHANSASPAAYGAETYVLGLHRTESQKHVAERENATIYLEDDNGAKYKDFDMSPDALIARQLQLAVFLDQSINFADKLQKEFKKLGRYDRGVKQAGFLVLYKTTMPSVLIETGFLTNPSDENFLSDSNGQQKMANSMFMAFENYKNELEGIRIRNSSVSNDTVQIEKQEFTRNEIQSEDVSFRVQIETSETKIAPNSEKLRGLDVYEYQQDGLFKYTLGNFVNDFEAANQFKNELRAKGFEHAFVVAFENGQRVNLEKAIKLAKK